MNQNFTTLFFLKKGKGYTSGPMPVYVRVTIEGKRAEASIQRSCEPARWNQKKGRVTGSNAFVSKLNTFLDVIQGKLFAVVITQLVALNNLKKYCDYLKLNDTNF